MICPECGIESKEAICPRCGVVLRPGSGHHRKAAPKSDPAPKLSKPPLRMKMVIWPAIALLLPLAYLFFDAFVLLSAQLFDAAPSGTTYLVQLVECLGDPVFETNTPGELAEAAMGAAVPLLTYISPVNLVPSLVAGQSELAPFLLPVIVTVLLALCCVAAAVLLLITGGRILRWRTFTNLTSVLGTAAVFSPLLGSLLLRVVYFLMHGAAGADQMMLRVLPSLESLAVMGILACALLPALATLRKHAAYAKREGEFVQFPYHILVRAPFRMTKGLVLGATLASVLLAALFLLLPVTNVGRFSLQIARADWLAVLRSLFAGNGTEREAAMADAYALCNLVAMLLVLIGMLFVLISLLRLLLTKKEALCKGRKLPEFAGNIRMSLLSPFLIFGAFQIMMTVVAVFFTPVAAHIDFANVTDTLSIVYLTAGRFHTLGYTTTLYAFLATAGALLWYSAGQGALALSEHAAQGDG